MKKLTKKSKEALSDRSDFDLMTVKSMSFWIAEFDRLTELKERLETSDERFDPNFSEKVEEIDRKIEEAAGHMSSELKSSKASTNDWDEIKESVYEYE